MKSLQELCASSLLQSNVYQACCKLFAPYKSKCICECHTTGAKHRYLDYTVSPPSALLSRCACDKYKAQYKNDYTTKEFAFVLPLPQILRNFILEIAEKKCGPGHPCWSDSSDEEDDDGEEEEDLYLSTDGEEEEEEESNGGEEEEEDCDDIGSPIISTGDESVEEEEEEI